jgi:Tol biopolymer transport system component
MNIAIQDSAGFYIMNRDLSGFKRVTNYFLSAPVWSPDGKWLAFSLGSNIYKMPFNGSVFDTSKIVQLTVSNGNFNPTWTAGSDSIIFDSNNLPSGTTGFYSIWKMASDGTGKTNLFHSSSTGDSRQPYTGNDGRIYFINYILSEPEVFSITQAGTTKTQITFNSKNSLRRSPAYFQGVVYFQDIGLSSTPVATYTPKEIAKAIDSYTISSSGEIVYATTEFGIYDKMFGTLWIMNADGSNNRQLTFNHY